MVISLRKKTADVSIDPSNQVSGGVGRRRDGRQISTAERQNVRHVVNWKPV